MAGKGLGRLRKRDLGLVSFCCALAALATGGPCVGVARSTIRPPAGTPDLSQMALRATDLPPGTSVEHQGYVHETGYVAAYKREFGSARVGHARLVELDCEVELDKTADDASLAFFTVQLVIAQKSTRTRLARELQNTAKGLSHRIRRITVERPRTLRIGDGAFVVPMTLYTSLGRFTAAIAFAVRDRVEIDMLAIARPGSRVTATGLAPLIAATADHVRAGLSPTNTRLPTVSGTAQLGQTLSAAPGAWSNPPVSIAYQWQRCDASGAACVAIPGATGQTYNVGVADPGATLRVAVTASNKVGASVAVSIPAPVAP
jgi:hypothetical protein